MQVHLNNGWLWFCVALALVLITRYIMQRLSKHFYTSDVVERRFSMIDIEWPDSPLELQNIVKGLYKLPDDKRSKAISSLKAYLLVDFIFMPAAYSAIFLLCMQLSWKMTSIGREFFSAVAWLQALVLLLDVVENIYLWQKIKPGMVKPSHGTYKAVQWLEYIKWGLPLLSVICAMSAVFYYWLVGLYAISSLQYLWIIMGEIALYLLLPHLLTKKDPEKAATDVSAALN